MQIEQAKRLLPGNRVILAGMPGVVKAIGYGQENDGDHFVRIQIDLDNMGKAEVRGNMIEELSVE